MAMTFEDMEAFYEALANSIDTVSERDLFLTRLALTLANALGDREQALAAIETSKKAGEV